jgi:hypothetical protein
MEPSTPPSTSFTNLVARPEPAVNRIRPFPGFVEALSNPNYVIYFEIKKNPQNAKQIAIRTSVFNLSATPFANFNMCFGVPLGWKIRTRTPSATVLELMGG